MPDVEVVFDEFLGQKIKQLVVAGRIGKGKIIDGVDQADAEVMSPDAVDEAACEEGIVLGAEPFEECQARVLAGLQGNFRTA